MGECAYWVQCPMTLCEEFFTDDVALLTHMESRHFQHVAFQVCSELILKCGVHQQCLFYVLLRLVIYLLNIRK